MIAVRVLLQIIAGLREVERDDLGMAHPLPPSAFTGYHKITFQKQILSYLISKNNMSGK